MLRILGILIINYTGSVIIEMKSDFYLEKIIIMNVVLVPDQNGVDDEEKSDGNVSLIVSL